MVDAFTAVLMDSILAANCKSVIAGSPSRFVFTFSGYLQLYDGGTDRLGISHAFVLLACWTIQLFIGWISM